MYFENGYYNIGKRDNLSMILRLINMEGCISRIQLSRFTGLTKTTITNIINRLSLHNLVVEHGQQVNASKGRKPVLLSINKDAYNIIGIYLSRDNCVIVRTDLFGNIKARQGFEFELGDSIDTVLSRIIRLTSKMANTDTDNILGIGIGSIGPIDMNRGIILEPPNFRNWKGVPIVSILKKHFPYPVFIDNDMNGCALAERFLGHGKKIENFVYLGVTNGLGTGIVINGQLYRGQSGFAGEIGHTTVDLSGEKCPCGNYGCLELYISIPRIIEQIKTALLAGTKSIINDICADTDQVTWPMVVEGALQGDGLALSIIDKMSFYLSTGLTNILNTFDPQAVFLGNELSIAGDLLVDRLKAMIDQRIFANSYRKIKISISKFAKEAPIIGATAIVLEKLYTGQLNDTVFK